MNTTPESSERRADQDGEGGAHCPLCEYDLRGLTEPRCPECGYRFTWEELNDPGLRLHPYAFEHHPERNAWSFRKTLLGGLRPGRFWRTLFPAQPSRPRRLMLYWLMVASSCVGVLAVQLTRSMIAFDADQAAEQRGVIAGFPRYDAKTRALLLARYGSAQAAASDSYPRWPSCRFIRNIPNGHLPQNLIIGAVIWVAWPWVTLAGLMIFQVSMRRAQVRPIHVLRCVIYASDVAVLWALVMGVILIWDAGRRGLIAPAWGVISAAKPIPLFTAVGLLLATWRLGSACKHYLRFEHAWAAAIAVQIMVALLVVKFVVDWDYLF